jgi:uncharacterized protein (DUF3820 family)
MAELKKVKVITWSHDSNLYTLTASIDTPKRSVTWNLHDFFPNVSLGKLDDLELGILFNGLKQRLSDKIALGKDAAKETSPDERLDAMKSLGDMLLEKRTYSVSTGAGGGGLSHDAMYAKWWKLAEEMAVGIKSEKERANFLKLQRQMLAGMFPKAKAIAELANAENK